MFHSIRIMTCIIWGVIGLALWIPLLIRTVMAFNLVMFFTIVTQNGKSVLHAHKNVQFATTFYMAGFSSIMNWTERDSPTDIPLNFDPVTKSIGKFAMELTWTAIWWSMFLYYIS